MQNVHGHPPKERAEEERRMYIISGIALVLGGWLLPQAKGLSPTWWQPCRGRDLILNPSGMINYYVLWPSGVSCKLLNP